VNCNTFEATERRPIIGHLLDERQPADTTAVYFAYYHGVERTRLVTSPPEAERAEGYVLLAQTGMDLFRPFLTLRLPPDMEQATKLIYAALRPETATSASSEQAVILNTPDEYMPLIRACFAIVSEEQLQVMVLDPAHFEPVVNVLVTQEMGVGGQPRFVIRHRAEDNQVLAVASVNWQTPHFADVSVNTKTNAQRQGYGRSVLAALINHLLGEGRRPIYMVRTDNAASIRLARSLGFFDSGRREWMLHAVLKSPPNDP
jgi:ribosomal protein S18 acetylase RimI-like enzyme